VLPHCASALEGTRIVRDGALHSEATVGQIKKGMKASQGDALWEGCERVS